MNKLLILDGNSVLHRAYYALPDWRNRSGEATAGVYGFMSMLIKALEQLKPTHLVIVFDHPSPTFRHNMYVGYQTNREKERQVSEDIWGQVDKLKQVFELIGVPVYQIAGFEADDVIGTISVQASAFSVQTIIITGDRDLMQLVDEKVHLCMPLKGLSDMTEVDRNKVHERLGVWPEEVIDYKALVGDSSDNYPGVPGIGPKTAVQLIEEFGSFEEIYSKIQNLKSKDPNKFQISKNQIQKLIDGYEGGELSKRLATIKRDVPVTYDNTQCSIPNAQKMAEVLAKLGYRSLTKRVDKTKVDSVNQVGLFD
ncbi:MAG: polymerase protein [Candidatus Amesbacteria bacterium GW2011_GWA2_42_12]|uniref:Polymerase protein n=1 Tax=Candidatus Amesbacteria bacterium GW2011_GWA2_42_12 TaxID=1618356 RepID=A0A0G1B612_9BACT|nr:MAG: polymerase protein [Candidatus Amesbacteria bacterium GW2011_GWA2_42_12]